MKTKTPNVRVLTPDEARAIIVGFGIPVSEATITLASAILRQRRVLLVQLTPGDYAAVTAKLQRLTLESAPDS